MLGWDCDGNYFKKGIVLHFALLGLQHPAEAPLTVNSLEVTLPASQLVNLAEVGYEPRQPRGSIWPSHLDDLLEAGLTP